MTPSESIPHGVTDYPILGEVGRKIEDGRFEVRFWGDFHTCRWGKMPLYAHVVDGTEKTFPHKDAIKAAGFTTWSKSSTWGYRRADDGEEIKGWGQIVGRRQGADGFAAEVYRAHDAATLAKQALAARQELEAADRMVVDAQALLDAANLRRAAAQKTLDSVLGKRARVSE